MTPKSKRSSKRRAERDPRDHSRHSPRNIDLAAIQHKPTFSVDEFCARHGFSRQTFMNWQARGIGPATARCGGRVFVTRESERLWLARCAATPAPAPAMPPDGKPRRPGRPSLAPVIS